MTIIKKIYLLSMPALFAIYSVLALFSHNALTIKLADITWILVAAVLLGAGLTGLLFLIFRDRSKASLIATCWLVVFFSYGQVYNILHKSAGPSIGRNGILLPGAVVLMVLSAFWVWKYVRERSRVITFFGWMIAILFLMTFYSLGRYFISVNIHKPAAAVSAAVAAPGDSATGPNIYYIILDAHGRQDILQEIYGYDNSEFIKFLKDRGFFVADSGQSNYAQTELSLSSSLNMQYLDTIGLPADSSSNSGRAWLDGKIQDSQVRLLLAQQGYKFVSFNNGDPDSPADADIYYNFDTTPSAVDAKRLMGPSEIEQLFLSSTMGRLIIDLGWFKRITDNQEQFKFHYLQTRYIFDKLAQTPSLPGRNFIYAHVLVPHPPFVFNSDGSYRNNSYPYTLADSDYPGTDQEYIDGYRNQVEYVDRLLEKTITDILAHSTPAPIILLQGDHGPGVHLDWTVAGTDLNERMSILNAYYFPGGHSGSLYPSITPVNSFRVLFNEYFGADYPLLADKSYFSTWDDPFIYIDVTAKLKK